MTPTADGLNVILHRDGQLSLNDDPLSIAHVVNQLQIATNAKRPIELLVDVDDAGQGATQELLQLQVELEKAQLGPRVQLKLKQNGKVPL